MPGFGTDPTLALNNARAAAQNPDGSFRPGQAYDAYRKLMLQQASQPQAATVNPNSPEGRADENRRKLYGLAEGRLGELKSDPTDALVMQALQDRATGKTNPYDQTTINALTTGQNDQAAHVAQQAMQQLSRSGLHATDPAYQSRVAEINAARQMANQQANLNINQQANVANYGAQGQALGGLGSFNMAHNQGITDQGRYLGNLYQQEQFRSETPPQQFQLPNFQQYAQMQQPAAPQVPQYQPAANQTQQTQPIKATASQTGAAYGPAYPAYNPIINGQQAMTGAKAPAYKPAGTGYIQLAGQPDTRVTTQPAQQPVQSPYNRYGATQTYGRDF